MISYDSDVGEQIVSNVKSIGETIKSGIASKISADYSALLSVGLFSSQISSIIDAVNELAESYESFAGVIAENKASWTKIQEETVQEATNFSEEVSTVVATSTNTGGYTSGGSNYSGSRNSTSSYSSSTSTAVNTQTDVENVAKGKEISTASVKELLVKVDSSVLPTLLQKITKLVGEEALFDLLSDPDKSDDLVVALKKILGDTTDTVVDVNADTKEIQKQLLEKLNLGNIDITTEEGQSALKAAIITQLNTSVDEAKWNELLYGNNTIKYEALGATWIVAKTNSDLNTYLDYVKNYKVRQDANPAEWGSSCLAFAGAHTYDYYYGTLTNGPSAAGYAHAGNLKDFLSDSKEEVLAEIYDQIMSGKPVVLQVNGNQAGTSRHFVTVVGFKEGVVSGATLKETDLLIIDSWDGKLESMDTAKSRFMTSGKQCHNGYTGYRLREIKA